MLNEIEKYIESQPDKRKATEDIRDLLFNISDMNSQPIDRVRWVSIDLIESNDYNPNSVAKTEMKLLYVSILHDGYTQPIVTIYDEEKNKHVIVDGFHRYYICKTYKDIFERNKGMLPIVVIKKDINDRMASTVRHNRARGKHSIDGMSSMVFNMLENGWKDSRICNELGLEAEELLKLKHITGFSKLFEDVEYRKAWETDKQVKLRMQYNESLKTEN
jgi:ParB-like chromosome segregation protein Spo0J